MFSFLKQKLLNSKDRSKSLPKVDSLGLVLQDPPKKKKDAFRIKPVFYRWSSLRFSIYIVKKSLDTFLFSLSSNVNLDVQQFVNLFISLFSEKSLFCVMLDGPHSHPLVWFLKKEIYKVM